MGTGFQSSGRGVWAGDYKMGAIKSTQMTFNHIRLESPGRKGLREEAAGPGRGSAAVEMGREARSLPGPWRPGAHRSQVAEQRVGGSEQRQPAEGVVTLAGVLGCVDGTQTPSQIWPRRKESTHSRERLGNRRQDSERKATGDHSCGQKLFGEGGREVGQSECREVLVVFQRNAQSLWVASGDSGLGEKDVHWHLPQSLVPRSPLVPAGPSATASRKPSLSPGAGRMPPEQASQGHSPRSTLICSHSLPDALGISSG